MYEHVAEHLLLYFSTASTAPHSVISPHKAAKQVRADQSATTQATRQSWRQPAHVVEQLYSTLSSQSEQKNRKLPGLQKYTTIHWQHPGESPTYILHKDKT